jgi:nucleotide-binding universal stress UspA family protein
VSSGIECAKKTATEEEVVFPTKILLATDSSEEAARAARLTVALSSKLDSELHVVYVEPLPKPYAFPESDIVDPGFREEIRRRAERDASEKVGQEAERIRGMGEVTETHARIGRPNVEIVSLAEEVGAGLLVIGSRGEGPIRRAVMGSVSASVSRHAHCPVLVVRQGGRDYEDRLDPVVLAVDGSKESKLAAGAAAEISGATGSSVHVIYVMPTEAELYGQHFYAEDVKTSLIEEAKASARRFLEEQAEGVRSAGGEVAQTYLGTGRPDEEIVELAEEIDAGMVVVGSRGLGGIRRALMGSVSDSVVRHAHCAVLVMRSARPEEDVKSD